MKKTLVAVVAFCSLVVSLFAFNVEEAAKEIYEKAGGNKTESQWKRYFKKSRWQKKLGLDKYSDEERAKLLSYLIERSAEKDSATVPQ